MGSVRDLGADDPRFFIQPTVDKDKQIADLERKLRERDDQITVMRTALKKIIDMNVQYAKDCWGDETRAETLACVVTARAALAKFN